MSGRPLDVLEASLGEEVTVRLKGGEEAFGELTGYDQHMNLVLENPALVRSGDGDVSPEAEAGLTPRQMRTKEKARQATPAASSAT